MTSKESLEFIIKTFNELVQKPQDIGLFFKFCEAHEIVKQDLNKLEEYKTNYYIALAFQEAQKEEMQKLRKAINILTNKGIGINVDHFKNTPEIEYYFLHYQCFNFDSLSKEEFDLLNEVLYEKEN